MTRLIRFTASVVALSVLLLGSAAQAVTIDWTTVGNPGNSADQNFSGAFGSVPYTYRISKTEVTNTQYTEFLNAVDAGGANLKGVYNTSMDPDTGDARGGIKFDANRPSGSKYFVASGRGSNPVVFVSFFDSMRFTNWLQNGHPTNGSGTETGTYAISDGLSETRAGGAKFFIPSENEWHKAAYYDPRTAAQGGPPGDDNYWLYPMKTDNPPNNSPPAGTSPAGNFFDDIITGYALTGSTIFDSAQNYLTDVGAYNTSPSYYGTFDQGGNAWEWNDSLLAGPFRPLQGGAWDNYSYHSNAWTIDFGGPTFETYSFGFRVAASVSETSATPEPSTFVLGALGLIGVGFIGWRRRRQAKQSCV